jgi:hypothetical protein
MFEISDSCGRDWMIMRFVAFLYLQFRTQFAHAFAVGYDAPIALIERGRNLRYLVTN